jgi:hypothetical protein
MKSSRNLLLLLMLLLFASVSSLLVSADKSSPSIKSISLINGGEYLIAEIEGQNFGKDPNKVKLVINDNGISGEILKVKAKKIVAQLPSSVLCSGSITIRALVNKIPSNPVKADLRLSAPLIEDLQPRHAQSGSIVEIRGRNLGCQPVENNVSFNGVIAEVLATGRNSISVRVPEIATGTAEVRIIVSGQISSPLNFIIDPRGAGSGSTGGSGSIIQFKESSGVPGASGFAPMFSVNESFLYSGLESSLWDAAFAGKHQAVIQAPWKTITGEQQVALLTLVCLHSNSLAGNISREQEKFVYVRLNFPVDPHKSYDPNTNPFWWGISGLATEHYPQGGLYYNSINRATGGVDSFLMSRVLPGKARLSLTMKVIAPDLFKYERYGENYEKAGEGIVSMPKVATVRLDFDQIDMRIPVAQYNIGSATIIDDSGKNPSVVTEKVQFRSGIFDLGELDDIQVE